MKHIPALSKVPVLRAYMNYLQSWMADHIADTIDIIAVAQVPKAVLHSKGGPVGHYIAMRTQYGALHHWPLNEDGVDIDHYDYDPGTHYFLATEHIHLRTRLLAGLRLTRVGDFDDSLSLSMWGHAVDKPHVVAQLIEHKQDVAELKQAARNGHLWDLTRLVTAMSLMAERSHKIKRATYVALLLLLGAAMRFTGPESKWLFTTNREMKRFLDRMGIHYTILAAGRIGYSDVGESYFGWTTASDAYEQLKLGQPIIARMVERGYTKGATPHSGADGVS